MAGLNRQPDKWSFFKISTLLLQYQSSKYVAYSSDSIGWWSGPGTKASVALQPLGLLYNLFSRSFHCRHQMSPCPTRRERSKQREGSNREFCLNADFHVTFRDLLHATILRHGTAGFTSLLKEGVLGICSPWKIKWLRPGLNTRTWVLEASTLPLDHRSC
jgi:hypothetical protein